jgi:flagellar M-ring protein FliF
MEVEMAARQTRELEARVRAMYLSQFDEVVVVANPRFNWDQVTTHERRLSNPNPDLESNEGLILAETYRTARGTGTTAAFEPGMAWNQPATPTYPTGAQDTGNVRIADRTTTFGYDEIATETISGRGGLIAEDSSLAVTVVNIRRIRQDYVSNDGYLGHGSWESLIAAMEGTTEPMDALDVEGMENAIRAATGIQLLSVRGYIIPDFIPSEVEPFSWEQFLMFAILAIMILLLAYSLIKRSQPDEITEVEPELSVEDLLVSTQMEEQLEAAQEENNVDFTSRESETKRQIERFVTEKPEAVAQLLRNWLNDEWE